MTALGDDVEDMTGQPGHGAAVESAEEQDEQPGFAVVDHEPTGNPVVDEVLKSLEHLEGAPVSEHVVVFEAAHEKLRSALADAGNDNSQPS
ncbi:MAG: hypothetical protein ACRDPJ_17830 [Nocardioidaceae bacterium]